MIQRIKEDPRLRARLQWAFLAIVYALGLALLYDQSSFGAKKKTGARQGIWAIRTVVAAPTADTRPRHEAVELVVRDTR